MQAKLKLNLEDLTVDSFDTTRSIATEGTVFGEQCSCESVCTCPGCPSCDVTCPNTCDFTCANTCDDFSCVASCEVTCEETCATCPSHKYTNCPDICY